MYPHRIRLRGPWEYDAGGPPRRVTMPCRRTDLGTDAGRVRCRRSFGLPRQLDPHERVWLVVEQGAGAVQELVLNEQPLNPGDGAWSSRAFEVTGLLARRNVLQIVAEVPATDCLLWDEVALEIRCTAFLHAVRVQVEPLGDHVRLHTGGEVLGEAGQPLEVYVLVENKTVAYAPVTAGGPFAVASDPLPAGQFTAGSTARVELVCGAVVWYSVDVPVQVPTP